MPSRLFSSARHNCSREATAETGARIQILPNWMRTAGEGGLSLVFASRAAVPHPASARNLPQRRTELTPSRPFPSARHNCSREATAETGARMAPAERKSKTSSQPKPKKQRQANQRKPNKHQRQAAKQTSKPAPACQENQTNQANQSCTSAKNRLHAKSAPPVKTSGPGKTTSRESS